jgi:putative phosphonate metabolism protein
MSGGKAVASFNRSKRSMQRFALYYAPQAGSDLETFGAQWLGRDVTCGTVVPQPPITGLSAADQATLTAEPRRYGLHGTLKPPFFLAEGQTVQGLEQAIESFCQTRQGFQIAGFSLRWLGRYLALGPTSPCPSLADLAADCVRLFDPFRAPPSETELARRRAKGLSATQEALLQQWGYPYVMEEFRFHLTLSAPVADPAQRQALEQAAEAQTAPWVQTPTRVDGIALYRQASPQDDFLLARRFAFSGQGRPFA